MQLETVIHTCNWRARKGWVGTVATLRACVQQQGASDLSLLPIAIAACPHRTRILSFQKTLKIQI